MKIKTPNKTIDSDDILIKILDNKQRPIWYHPDIKDNSKKINQFIPCYKRICYTTSERETLQECTQCKKQYCKKHIEEHLCQK